MSEQWTQQQYREYILPITRTPEGMADWERRWGVLRLGTNPPEWNIPLGWDERDAKI